MKKTIRGALIYFLINFIIIIVFGLFFLRSAINFTGIVRALVIASASAFAWFLVYYRERKRKVKK